MEDNQNTPQTNTTFADVKLPQSSTPTPINVAVSQPELTPTDNTTGLNTITPAEAVTPEPVSTVNVPIQVQEDQQPSVNPEQSTQNPSPLIPNTPTHKKGGGHMIAIFIAIIIFIGLAGAVVYVYMQSNSTDITRKGNTSNNTSSITPATASDVDEVTKEIDDNLETISPESDFKTSDVDDSTLGL